MKIGTEIKKENNWTKNTKRRFDNARINNYKMNTKMYRLWMSVRSLRTNPWITFLIKNPILGYWYFLFEINSTENDSILRKMYSIFNNVIFLFESKLSAGVIGLYIYFFDRKLSFYKNYFVLNDSLWTRPVFQFQFIL